MKKASGGHYRRLITDRLALNKGNLGGGLVLFFAAKGGGVQKSRVTLANALAARGIEVSCVLPQATGPFLEQLSSDVRLVDLGTRHAIPLVRRFARYLRQHRPAVVLASQQHTILAAVWARRLAGVEVCLIITQHNTLSELCRQSRRPTMRYLLPRVAPRFFRSADVVCAVSHGVADDFAAMTGIPRSDIRVIYDPTVTPQLAEQAALASGHSWLDAKDRPVVLGWAT